MENKVIIKNKMKHTIIFIFCLIFLSSCNNFEKRFYQKMDEARASALENGFAYFDLSTVTDFEWDSVLFFGGARVVFTEYKEQIEEILNNSESYIHWEKRRFKGEIDTLFRWHTTDLRPGRDRLFFLTSDKKIIEKEIKHHRQNGRFYFSYCDTNENGSRKTFWRNSFWLSKQEANFLLVLETGMFEVNCTDEKSNEFY